MKYEIVMVCPLWKRFNAYKRNGPCFLDNIPPRNRRATEAFEFLERNLRELAADDHIAFVWAPGKHAADCREYMEKLGYLVRGSIMWIRPRWQRGCGEKALEFLIICSKGPMPKLSASYMNMIESNFTGTVRSKLEKPAEAFKFLEKEFFSKRKLLLNGWTDRPGWTVLKYNEPLIT